MDLKELSEFARSSIRMSREEWDSLREILKDDAAMNRLMKKEWFEKPRDSDQAVMDYYRESKIWFMNTFNHGWLALLALADRNPSMISRQEWLRIFESNLSPGDQVLDYGGGFWNDTALMALDGWTVVQAEVDGPTTRFLSEFTRWIRMEDQLKVFPVNSSFPLQEIYGGVACFELLEHLLYPKAFAEHLRNHLAPGKPIGLSVSFSAPEHAPYHIASNEPLGRDDNWWAIMKEMGFDHLWTATDSHRQVWRKR
jgi:hypothetical protein